MKLHPLYFLMILLFLCACHATKETTTTTFNFPEDWIGKYKGNLELYNSEHGKTMELPMTIIISATDTANQWNWYSSAIYNGREIIKDYLLIRHDSMPKNHFYTDERNGILLDRVLMDNCFYDYFEVGNSGLFCTTSKRGKDLFFEISSFPLNSKNYSIFPVSEVDMDTVISFKVVNTQKGLMKKVD